MRSFRPTALQPLHRKRGTTLLVMLIILVLGAATIFVGSLSSSALQIGRDKITANALGQAKDALIGRAVADLTSPGSLPCPDTNNDGAAESPVGQPGGNCPSYIGRLPWKTLELPDLRDGSGERLWYALSPDFRDYVALNPINSNNKGMLLAYDNSGIALLTPLGSEAVAIVFAPGYVVGAQQRNAATENLAQNYLDIGPNGINNYSAAGPFIAADKTGSFNDRLLIIRASDIMPAVEKRVAKELAASFANYLAANGNKYPYPANFSCTSAANCISDATQCIGKIPVASMATPPWFASNNWFDVIYYSAGANGLASGGGGSGSNGWGRGGRRGGGWSGAGGTASGSGTGCYAATLSVSGSSANALFIMPGTPLGGITRTSISANNLPSYFEDQPDNTNIDNVYVIPGTSAPGSNDSIYTLP